MIYQLDIYFLETYDVSLKKSFKVSRAFMIWNLEQQNSSEPPLFSQLSVNFIFQSGDCVMFHPSEWKRRGTHLSRHLLRKMPLLSGYSLLQGPFSARAGITR